MRSGATRSTRCGALAALLWAAASVGVAAPGCSASEPPRPARPRDDARRAEVRFPSEKVIEAEIADTPLRWQQGYMFRREVRQGDGMLFVYPEADFHSFWMKNTLVPLDMIWMDDEGTVIHIEASVPPCKADPCPGYGPPRKARYALEVRGGTTAREGLKVGDRLRISFPGSPR